MIHSNEVNRTESSASSHPSHELLRAEFSPKHLQTIGGEMTCDLSYVKLTRLLQILALSSVVYSLSIVCQVILVVWRK